MGKVVFHKDSISVISHDEESYKLNGSLILCLDYVVELDEDITFGDVLYKFINDPFKAIFNLMLSSYAGGIINVLNQFSDILSSPAESLSEIDYVYIAFDSITVNEYYEINNRTPEQRFNQHVAFLKQLELDPESTVDDFVDPLRSQMPSRWGFHGYGDLNDEHYTEETGKTKTSFAIEFTPINELAHLPFRIKQTAEIYDWKNWNKSDHGLIDTFEAYPTVFDLITAIVWEMTWFGVVKPGDKTILDDYHDMIDRINSGEEELIEIKFNDADD